MKIPMNKDMEEFKEDFYKGLNLKETVLAVFIFLAGLGIFVWAYFFMGMSQNTSAFLTMVVTFPTGIAVYRKKYGMSMMEYYFRIWDVKRHPLYLYETQTGDGWEATCSTHMEEGKKKRKRWGKRKGRIYFDQEEGEETL